MHLTTRPQTCRHNAEQTLSRKRETQKNVKGKTAENNFRTLCKIHLQPFGTKTGGRLLKGEKRDKEEWGGSRAQSIPQMKSKRQSVRHKHACHPWELAGGWWLIRVLLSLFLCKWERSGKKENETGERKREGFISHWPGRHDIC